MEEIRERRFNLDGDTITVCQVYDSELGIYRNDYPDFEESPRVTPTGRQWVSVFKEDCPHATSEYGDCGSCDYFRCENQGDLIGICDNEALKLAIIDGNELQRKEA